MKRVLALLIALSFGIAFAALNGIPKDVQGFAKWKKVVTTGMPLDGPHAGKNKVVYANAIAAKAWAGKAAFPVGSLVVKTAGSASAPDFVGIMRKTAKGWDYEEYLDVNSDFKRAMGVNNVPYLCIIDGNGNIVYESNNYLNDWQGGDLSDGTYYYVLVMPAVDVPKSGYFEIMRRK